MQRLQCSGIHFSPIPKIYSHLVYFHFYPQLTGWLNAYREGGWLPSWASPGYRNCMVGTFADVVVADAIVKNVPNFDLALAREALMKDVSLTESKISTRVFFM